GTRGARVPREGRRRVPADRRGASGAIRRDRRGPRARRRVRRRARGDRESAPGPARPRARVTSPSAGTLPAMAAVLDRVTGQASAVAFLRRAAERPHHAYILAGPEGSGKSLVARAFVAALLCHDGGCGVCRDCTLAMRDHHPNEFLVEPEGRDIHIDPIRDEVWQHAYRTSPEPGQKVFVIREADRLSPPAADTLLKVLEEPPADTVF